MGGVLVVANIGVWYNQKTTYAKDMDEFIPWLDSIGNQVNKRNAAIFLESFPGHWDSSSGYHLSSRDLRRSLFPSRSDESNAPIVNVSSSTPICCHRISDRSSAADWRNAMAADKVRQHNATAVSILPLAEAFRDAHNMHNCMPGYFDSKNDCTHYCFWPTALQFEWRVLRTIAVSGCVGSQCVIPQDV
jgi:hypothetical protein